MPKTLKQPKKLNKEQIDKAIQLALSAPFPTLAIHHLIDKIIEIYEPKKDN